MDFAYPSLNIVNDFGMAIQEKNGKKTIQANEMAMTKCKWSLKFRVICYTLS